MSKPQHKPPLHIKVTLLLAACISTFLLGNVKPASAYENSKTIGKAATITSCSDVEVIFAHGAASDFNSSPDVAAWHEAMNSSKLTNLSYDYYYLGQSNYYGKIYKGANIGTGSLVELKNTAETYFSAGNSGEFQTSVAAGIQEISGRITDVLTKCPNTKFVFGGYSEGSFILHKFFNEAASTLGLTADNVIYIATFGDPKLYLPEGEGLFPPACNNQNFSSYRIYAPNCRAHSGILGAAKPDYFPAAFIKKVGLWCTKEDVMCSNYFNIFNLAHIVDDHLNYADHEPYPYQQAAIIIRQAIAKAFQIPNIEQVSRDTVILIDTTSSMANAIKEYKNEALKIAKTTLATGGRIALAEYRDIKADGAEWVPHMLCDFSCTYDEFQARLKNLNISGGGDIPESALSAILKTMNSLDWHAGATKSIILLTDAKYHEPDHDGTTLADVVKRSLEIDPVNVYVVAPDSKLSAYNSLVAGTNGQAFALGSTDISISSNVLLNRPDLAFQYNSYTTSSGEVLTFNLNTSATDVDHYEWDLDQDGIFEITTTTPSISSLYSLPTSGFVQAKVITTSGLSSSASAALTVYPKEETNLSASIDSIDIKKGNHSASVSLKATGAEGYLVILDDYILGLTKSQIIHLKDLADGEHNLLITPISASGTRGEGVNKKFLIGKISSTAKIPTAPNTALPRR
ncbi:cutinase family protein [Candidatus Saccharibacteria bacterium]|nr:cutinase family protein [Candidatus Saccharibacteria bacterium]